MTKADLWVYSITFAIFHLFISDSQETSILVFITVTVYVILLNLVIKPQKTDGDDK